MKENINDKKLDPKNPETVRKLIGYFEEYPTDITDIYFINKLKEAADHFILTENLKFIKIEAVTINRDIENVISIKGYLIYEENNKNE